MRLLFERVPKENEKVNVALRNFGTNLLISAERAALQLVNRDTNCLLEYFTCRSGSKQFMFGKEELIILGPVNQVLLFVIMGHQGDFFLGEQRRFRFHTSGSFLLFSHGCLAYTPAARNTALTVA